MKYRETRFESGPAKRWAFFLPGGPPHPTLFPAGEGKAAP